MFPEKICERASHVIGWFNDLNLFIDSDAINIRMWL